MVNVCPNCGSPEIEYASMMRESTISIAGFGLPEKYYCKGCGYEGSVILEMPADKVGKVKFHNKPVKIPMPDKASVEIVKPVFMMVVFLFFAVTVFMAFNPVNFGEEPDQPEYYTILGEKVLAEEIELPLRDLGTMKMPGIKKEMHFLETAEGELLVAVYDVDLIDIGSATGTGMVKGFTFDLFMTIFISGLLVLLIAHHWQRKMHFM